MKPYIVVMSFVHTGEYVGELEERVNEKIEEGYQPIGGIAVDDSYNCYQAMVKQHVIEHKLEVQEAETLKAFREVLERRGK